MGVGVETMEEGGRDHGGGGSRPWGRGGDHRGRRVETLGEGGRDHGGGGRDHGEGVETMGVGGSIP